MKKIMNTPETFVYDMCHGLAKAHPELEFVEKFKIVKKKDIKYMYERWTGQGLITRKAFVNRKSALNGVFIYAAENEYIPFNFIPSI